MKVNRNTFEILKQKFYRVTTPMHNWMEKHEIIFVGFCIVWCLSLFFVLFNNLIPSEYKKYLLSLSYIFIASFVFIFVMFPPPEIVNKWKKNAERVKRKKLEKQLEELLQSRFNFIMKSEEAFEEYTEFHLSLTLRLKVASPARTIQFTKQPEKYSEKEVITKVLAKAE